MKKQEWLVKPDGIFGYYGSGEISEHKYDKFIRQADEYLNSYVSSLIEPRGILKLKLYKNNVPDADSLIAEIANSDYSAKTLSGTSWTLEFDGKKVVPAREEEE